MRSAYESFLRRQLLKPRATPARWSDTQPAPARPKSDPTPPDLPQQAEPPALPELPAPSLSEAPVASAPPATRAQLALPEQIEETMPAILWRDSRAPSVEPQADSAASHSPAPAATAVATPAGAEALPDPATADTATAPTPSPARRGTPSLADLDQLVATAVAHAQQRSGLGALLRIGVARLDEIGDAWGERAVSHVLRALHQRLARLLATVAPQARALPLGDALWVLLPALERNSVAEALVRQLLEALTRPLHVGEHSLALHGSAGVAVFPHDGSDASSLRRAAEVAGRQARGRGRSAYQFYAREIEARAQRRLALEARLRHALGADELQLQYLPRAEVRSGALCGAEVQTAWTPGEQAPWRASELLLLAEESGLAEALAHWSLRAACRQLRAWIDAGLAVPRLSLPLLPSPLKRPGFVETLIEQVRAHRLDPARITLLLSPVAPLAASPRSLGGFDLAHSAPRLRQCREAGFRLAIDGAATSTCSLATLRQLPLSELRLDGHLLGPLLGTERTPPPSTPRADPGDNGFAAAIVALGHGLGLRVVASGIRQDAQLDLLAELGCDEFQGELLSEPLDASTWAEVMAGAQAAGQA